MKIRVNVCGNLSSIARLTNMIIRKKSSLMTLYISSIQKIRAVYLPLLTGKITISRKPLIRNSASIVIGNSSPTRSMNWGQKNAMTLQPEILSLANISPTKISQFLSLPKNKSKEEDLSVGDLSISSAAKKGVNFKEVQSFPKILIKKKSSNFQRTCMIYTL